MTYSNEESRTLTPRVRLAPAVLLCTFMVTLGLVGSPAAHAQTFSVVHNFTVAQTGFAPITGVTIDQAGNLYGTTEYGGDNDCNINSPGCGTVYRLKPSGSNWVFSQLFAFNSTDGANPRARVIFGPNHLLYGTTYYGSNVFKLGPPANFCGSISCPWTETVLHQFTESEEATGQDGEVLFDQAGNIYGNAGYGGPYGLCGAVYQLTPSGIETTIYGFQCAPDDGQGPTGNLVMDNAGNLYGTTYVGGPQTNCGENGCGTVFELSPQAGGGWTETILYFFTNGSDGSYPAGGLVMDHAGNLYGATIAGAAGGSGAVFELSPSNGGWQFRVLYSFMGTQRGQNCGPQDALAFDAAGNLYGTTLCAGTTGFGNVFELFNAGGNFTYLDLHEFNGANSGQNPASNVAFDAAGNLYGTAAGGTNGVGVVWEIAR